MSFPGGNSSNGAWTSGPSEGELQVESSSQAYRKAICGL